MSALDRCPKCGKAIGDLDSEGCEAPDGQRWCVGHALEALAEHRRPPRTVSTVLTSLGIMGRTLTVEELLELTEKTGRRYEADEVVTLFDVVRNHCQVGYGGHFDEPYEEETLAYEVAAANQRELETMVAYRQSRARVLQTIVEAWPFPPPEERDWQHAPCERCGGRGWHELAACEEGTDA